MPLTTGLEDTHVLITGGAGLIGSAVVDAFCEEGARVSVVDLLPPDRYVIDDAAREPGSLDYYQADITDEESLDDAWSEAVATNGPVSCCVALASLDLSVLEHHGTAADMSVKQFRRTLDVNVTGTFLTARMWMQGVQEEAGKGEMSNVSLILVGSESGWLGERTNPDYAASKSAVQVGLLKSLAADAPRLYEEAR
ncbi:Polysaccharide deacetylase family protein [Neofusicoccum parvum]|uniref:Polysaccharide deacetylase family protein n=2 Tax=Neofusicoccum parvum TaxID=310453 RepID=A0ACB5RZU1_9PEZI|nr:putative polysaccharide deacetylase family protein [Neofusicoccum parvum UCRNP2]GME25990.1 Polysaccharide deacetylase family protein [Neofusicoccum parvum]GME55010.1 Polysaccharide deacetylase family protein [Neofusicoccum parvum]